MKTFAIIISATFVSAIILGVLLVVALFSKPKLVFIHAPYPINIKAEIPPLTKENVLKEIIKQDIKEPLIVLRQVLWETGHLKCTNCSLDYSNLFGFTSDKMIKFDNWIESIRFYKEWQIKYTGGDYYEFLKKYWGAPEMDKYCDSLKQIKI